MGAIDSKVINIDELKLEHFDKGDKFESDAVRIGKQFRLGMLRTSGTLHEKPTGRYFTRIRSI